MKKEKLQTKVIALEIKQSDKPKMWPILYGKETLEKQFPPQLEG